MQIKRKTISILQLTQPEVDHLITMIEEARAGHTVHYSETQTGPGQYFGISIGNPERDNGETVAREVRPMGWDKV